MERKIEAIANACVSQIAEAIARKDGAIDGAAMDEALGRFLMLVTAGIAVERFKRNTQ